MQTDANGLFGLGRFKKATNFGDRSTGGDTLRVERPVAGFSGWTSL